MKFVWTTTSKLLTVGLASLALLACSGKSSPPDAPSANAKSAQTSEQSATQATPHQNAISIPTPQVNRDVALADYIDLDKQKDPQWATYAFVARQSPTPSDEQKLDLFSPAYVQETDVFKKHALAASELTRINAILARYASEEYYVTQQINPTDIIDAYDFSKQGFSLPCDDSPTHYPQGVFIAYHYPGGKCFLHVPDQTLAREIESQRSQSQILLRFRTYFHLTSVDGNTLQADVTHQHVELLQSTFKDRLAAQHGIPFPKIASFDLPGKD